MAGKTASIGTIGARTKKVFTGPPLIQYSFDEDCTKAEEQQVCFVGFLRLSLKELCLKQFFSTSFLL